MPPRLSGLVSVLLRGFRVAGADLVRSRWFIVASLVAAIIVWLVIEDIENPRVEAVVPGENYQAIPVDPVNLPDGLVIRESFSVRVRVKANADDIPGLTADDFRATIDVRDIEEGKPVSRSVQVVSNRDDVRVVAVQPPDVRISAEAAATREFAITVRVSGEPPAGFRIAENSPLSAEPALAEVSGRADLVETVASIEIEVNVSGVRESSLVIQSDLVARSAGGNRVDVTVSPARARATVQIEQIVSQRLLTVTPVIEGNPAPGYLIASVSVDPATVIANGPTNVVEGLTSFRSETVNITGAESTVVQTRSISEVPNVILDHNTVVIRVAIKPIDGEAIVFIAPEFVDVPEGLSVDGLYTIEVSLVGPVAELSLLRSGDITVTVSLEGAQEGPNTVSPTVTLDSDVFPNVSTEDLAPLSVVLVVEELP